jgi:hypothetical protein
MRNKIIYSEYNPETGDSIVVIHNKLGEFYGTASLHPEDKDIASSFVGCRYAEVRAHISCEQYKKEMIDIQIKALKDFENILKGRWNYNEDSMETRRLRKRMHELKAERKKISEKIAALKKALRASMDERDAFVKKYLTNG